MGASPAVHAHLVHASLLRRIDAGTAQLGLGLVVLAEGQSTLAQESLMGALSIFRDVGDRTFEDFTLAFRRGDYPRAR